VTYVYMVECSDSTLYTGWTVSLARRMAAHNAGRGARYTRGRLPVRLVYWEGQPDRSSAQRREVALRDLPRAAKLRLITELAERDPSIPTQ